MPSPAAGHSQAGRLIAEGCWPILHATAQTTFQRCRRRSAMFRVSARHDSGFVSAQTRAGSCRAGLDTGLRLGRRGPRRRYRPAAERRAVFGRRPGLQRGRLLRAEEDSHAQHRSAGGRGHAVHELLLRQRRLRAVALRVDDRLAPGARVHSRQSLGSAGGAVSDSGRHGDAGKALARPGLRQRRIRQVGAWPAGQHGRPARAGLRPFLRLQLPGGGAQLLSDVPVGQRPQGRARQSPVCLEPEAAGGFRSERPGQLRALRRPAVRRPI